MKKHLFFLFFSLFAFVTVINVSYAQNITTTIGKIDNGNPVLTVDKIALLKKYNTNLQKVANIDGQFTNVSLISVEGDDYVLVFFGKDYKSVISVKREGQILLARGTISCTTSDCSQETTGCVPKFEKGSDLGYCTPCNNGGKCTKTVSSISLLE
jgi:hypothetical protein